MIGSGVPDSGKKMAQRPETLEQFVERTEHLFKSFNERRINYVIWFFAASLVTFIVCVWLAASLDTEPKNRFAIVLVAGVLGVAVAYAPLGALRQEFKIKFVPVVLREFGYSFDHAARNFPVEYFSNILPAYHDGLYEDHVWGVEGGVGFEIAKAQLTKGGGKYKRTVFDGLLCRFAFPKIATAPVLVRTDRGVIGRLFSEAFEDVGRVRLESEQFEALFDVYSHDQVHARYILTPTLMERLIELRRAFGDMTVLFYHDEILIALNDNQDLFCTGGPFSDFDPELLFRFRHNMGLIFSVIETLKLDQKTKV